ncbi:MAG: hypothetical protein NT161_02775 [Candidatus Nomurabacteria bacterium]|nr:hypothetical protein [Candidatus Nomurabacteria bacterium]
MILVLSPLVVSADMIPLNSHVIDRCVKVVNLDKFTDVVLIGYTTDPAGNFIEAKKIENNVCFNKGYKFNSFNIYWTTKSKFNSIDLNNINLVDLSLLSKDLQVYGGYVDNSNPIKKENIEYSINKISENKLGFFQSNQTVETQPIKKGFWRSIGCFFRGLFGKGC